VRAALGADQEAVREDRYTYNLGALLGQVLEEWGGGGGRVTVNCGDRANELFLEMLGEGISNRASLPERPPFPSHPPLLPVCSGPLLPLPHPQLRRTLPWADAVKVKEELDRQTAALLGPKTEVGADPHPPPPDVPSLV